MVLLAVDDDFTQLSRIRAQCTQIQYPKIELLTAESLSSALAVLGRNTVDIILSDFKMEDGTGLDLLRFAKALNPLVPVVIMTAYSDTREAVKLLKMGADDYLIKPVETADIEKILIRINEKNLLIREKYIHIPHFQYLPNTNPSLVYVSATMASLLRLADQAARSSVNVLIRGESGVGKETLARFIHERSPRGKREFLSVNVASNVDEKTTAQLFGNGAQGILEKAKGGSLLIKEISALSPALQVELFEYLDAIERQCDVQEKVDDTVRLLFSSIADLNALVEEGLWRRDLLYRIGVISIEIPPLRERKEDIVPIVEHCIARANARNKKNVKTISREAMDRLMRHSFKGNVRELEMIVEHAVVLASTEYILERDLPPLDEDAAQMEQMLKIKASYEMRMSLFERELISDALRTSQGNKSAAARELGINERHLRSRLERLALAGYAVDDVVLQRKISKK